MDMDKWIRKELKSLKKWEAAFDKKLEKLELIAGIRKSRKKRKS